MGTDREKQKYNVTVDVVGLQSYEPAVHGARCRDSYGYLNESDFQRWTCSKCFVHIFDVLPHALGTLTLSRPPLVYDPQLRRNTDLFYVGSDPTLKDQWLEPDAWRNESRVCALFLSDDQCTRWRKCCSQAARCCANQLRNLEENGGALQSAMCRMTWDGFACWNDTQLGTVAYQTCPDYYQKRGIFDQYHQTPLRAAKTCTNTGWFNSHAQTAPLEWTDPSMCIDDEAISKSMVQVFSTLAVLLHAVSITALFLSIFVLFLCRNIGSDVTRLMLKVHFMLFCAFAGLHTVLLAYESLYYIPILQTTPITPVDPLGCKVLNVLLWYLRGATYCSMLCEVFYLLRRMQIRAESESFVVYILIAWLIPLFPVAILVAIRHSQYPSDFCWMIDDSFALIITIPNVLVLVINLCVLIKVQHRVIRSYQAAKRYLPNLVVVKRGVKIAGLLLPVFGFQNIIIIYRPQFWIYFELIEAIVIGTQGIIIAVVYCGLNNEIRKELRKIFSKYQRYRRSTGFTSSAMSIIRRSNASRPSAEVQRLSVQNASASASVAASVNGPASFGVTTVSVSTTEPLLDAIAVKQTTQTNCDQNYEPKAQPIENQNDKEKEKNVLNSYSCLCTNDASNLIRVESPCE